MTPDSFSDGGRFVKRQGITLEKALRESLAMVEQGAGILDIGGESTRPGAEQVSVQQELDRVIPLIENLATETDVTLSVDTSTPAVMREAVAAGATLLNDVRAFQREGALQQAAELEVPVVLMHMQGKPSDMQDRPAYQDVVEDVISFLTVRAEVSQQAGIPEDYIVLDPGFGFGKTMDHNYQLLANLNRLSGIGYPLLVGMSRKSMIGDLLDIKVDDRMTASVVLAALAAMEGVKIVRVHDVKETARAMKIVDFLRSKKS